MSTHKDARFIRFRCHGREKGEGKSSFGDDNLEQLKTLDDNSFEGCAESDWCDRCEIYGK